MRGWSSGGVARSWGASWGEKGLPLPAFMGARAETKRSALSWYLCGTYLRQEGFDFDISQTGAWIPEGRVSVIVTRMPAHPQS